MNRRLAVALLIFANILWGSSYVVAKVALREIPPPLLGALRVTLAALLLGLPLLWQVWRGGAAALALPGQQARRGDMARLAALGLLGVGASYLIDYWGISLSTATDASLMIIGEVIFTALLAAWLAAERLGRRKLLGIGFGAAGVATLVLGNAQAGADGGSGWLHALGNLLILLALLCESFYTVLGARLARRYTPLAVLALANGGSLVIWLPILGWYVESGSFPALSWAAILGVAYLAAVTSALCYVIWFGVLRHAGASVGAISLFVQPLVGSLLGLFLLGDPLTLGLAIGAALIFTALYLTSVPEREHTPLAEPTVG
jgi:drug/metabolite transporter (DMT)-like permease